jgi:hypothetical protein
MACFVDKVLLEHNYIHSFIYVCLSLQWQSWVLVADTEWPKKSKIFTVFPFAGKVYYPWID